MFDSGNSSTLQRLHAGYILTFHHKFSGLSRCQIAPFSSTQIIQDQGHSRCNICTSNSCTAL